MPRPARASLPIALAASALALGACGSEGDGTIPAGDADQLLQTLGEVRSNVETGDCTSAQTDATQFVTLVNDLPKEAGAENKEVLRAAGTKLVELVNEQCEDPQAEPAPAPETGATGALGAQDNG